MAIVALNCGSSSIKAAVFGDRTHERLFEAQVDGVGSSGAVLRCQGESERIGATDSIERLLQTLKRRLLQPASAVVHRVVHGGERFTQPARIDDAVLAELDSLSALAPLHNPPAIAAIRAARREFGSVPHFAVFDTAFHATLPPHAREYALPKDLRARHGIRRYGFHGISHAHVMSRVARSMSRSAGELRIVSCHLGNGASVTAIGHGRSVDTSMGMTPLEGLVMGSRAGDLDPGILLDLLRTQDRETVSTLLNRESGLKGLAGTNDMREIGRRAEQGDADCRLARDMYVYRLAKYIGAYAAAMRGIDALAFTGGIGENSASIRRGAVERLEFLGVRLDESRNLTGLAADEPLIDVAAPRSSVRVLVMRADEEFAMAEAIAPYVNAIAQC